MAWPRTRVADGLPGPWILGVAVVTVLVRLAGLWPPLRADEAGFLLVARSWDPEPSSMFGDYWVDRPPLLIAVFRAADGVGGPHFLRVVGALACGLVVLLAARVAVAVGGTRAAGWTAVAVAAVVGSPTIDLVAVKGEQLGVPLVLGSMVATLAALRRRSWELALVAGLLAGMAPGLKQNLLSGLVFAAVVLVGARLAGRLSPSETLRFGAAGLAGVSVPVLAQGGWVVLAGVEPAAAWHAIYGFRSEAAMVLATEGEAHLDRGAHLFETAVLSGLAVVLVLFVASLPAEWAVDPVLAAATAAVVVTEVLMVVLGGSYWADYLFTLVPGAALAVGHLAGRPPLRGSTMRAAVVATVVSCLLHLDSWSTGAIAGEHRFTEARTGEAIARAAAPGDTLTVFGGRADVQYAAGLPSPYPYLWSLPMRTLDPDYEQLSRLLAGSNASTWLVEWVSFEAWGSANAVDLRAVVAQRYVEHGLGCDGRSVYLLATEERPALRPDCE